MARARRRGGATAFFGGFLWMLVLIAMALAVFGIWEIHRPGPNPSTTQFDVPRGATTMQIARSLQEKGVIRNIYVFRVAADLYAGHGSLKAGEYEAEAGESLRSLLEKIESGRLRLFPVTIAEGLTTDMIVDILKNSTFMSGELPNEPPPEGSLLPETYLVPRGSDRAELLARMQADQEKVLQDLWEKRAPNLPVKTMEEAVILASIVEKETGVAEERPRVAAVFTNRLRRGMRLESDPTIIYGVSKGRPLGRGIRRSELDGVTPYNTYKNDGLTPTPICNPGRASIEAVLNPAQTEDLFFVASGNGGHVFAATVEEHNRNVAAWRLLESRSQTRPPTEAPPAPQKKK